MQTQAAEWCVVTWNIHARRRPDLDRVAEVIGATAPDVVCLQEITHGQAASLAELLGMRFTWAFKHQPLWPFFRSRAEGLALLTPHRLDAAAHTVISTATSKRSWRRRIVQWGLVSRDDASGYRIYNIHLSPHDLSAERRTEAVRVAELEVEHGESPPAIVAGDFNDGDDPTVIFALPGIEHVPAPPSQPAGAPTVALDHVLLPVEATDVSVMVPGGGPEWATLSDHLPVTVRFSMEWVAGSWARGGDVGARS